MFDKDELKIIEEAVKELRRDMVDSLCHHCVSMTCDGCQYDEASMKMASILAKIRESN